jgi:hypothetical protein
MRLAGLKRRSLLLLLVLPAAWVAIGCSGPVRPARLADWQRPERLYLSEATCPRLYVQIDRVDSVSVRPAEVQALLDFLARHCRKPAGITVHRSGPIDADQLAGRDEVQLALSRMDMPDELADSGRTAYLYVLFYDSSQLPGRKPERPYVRTEYPAAIFVDVAYFTDMTRPGLKYALQHEASHVLGLCKNPAHSDGAHCNDPGCLSNAVVPVPLAAYGLPGPRLCSDCLADLEATRAISEPANMRFVGPVLLRIEPGYVVACLPSYTQVVFGEPDQIDRRALLSRARSFAARSQKLHDQMRYDSVAPRVLGNQPERLETVRAAVDRATRDPDAGVARVAAQLRRKLRLYAGPARP